MGLSQVLCTFQPNLNCTHKLCCFSLPLKQRPDSIEVYKTKAMFFCGIQPQLYPKRCKNGLGHGFCNKGTSSCQQNPNCTNQSALP